MARRIVLPARLRLKDARGAKRNIHAVQLNLAIRPGERDAVLRFKFAMAIGISFGSAASFAATTEVPPQRRSRRGRIPKRIARPEWSQYRSVCECKPVFSG